MGAAGNSRSQARVKDPSASPRKRIPEDLSASRDLPHALILRGNVRKILDGFWKRSEALSWAAWSKMERAEALTYTKASLTEMTKTLPASLSLGCVT